MAEISNGNDPVKSAGLLKHFRHFPWQTQCALVLALTGGSGGVLATASRFFEPDPAVAQLVSNTAQVATTSVEVAKTTAETRASVQDLNASISELSANLGELNTLMTLYVCETESDSQWMMSLGPRGVQFCNKVRDRAVDIIIQDVYRQP